MAHKKFKISNLKFQIVGVSLIVFIFLISFPHYSFANSDYVLPYPSALPGSRLYGINLIKERVQNFWYFGDFGQFKYNLKQSDKYLVEAKTLFEYRQYLLGYEALGKSDTYFKKTLPNLSNAQKKGKNINVNRKVLRLASEKHIEVLLQIKENVPAKFVWTPEKDSPTTLDLLGKLEVSIKIRKEFL